MTVSANELQLAKMQYERRDLMPELASSPAGCLRWRWSDLEDAIMRQLAMLEDEYCSEPTGLVDHEQQQH